MHRIINAVPQSLIAWLALFVASIAVAPPVASAHCGQSYPCYELEIEALNPPIGTSFGEGQEGPWAMSAAHGLQFVWVYVNTSPETGSDGHTLSDLYRADFNFFTFSESGTDEGVYTSQGPSQYLRPGTYYWQMEAVKYSASAEYQTPIYSFVVTPKPAPPSPPPPPQPVFTPSPTTPPIPLAKAYADVKTIIRSKTGRSAHHLSDSCTFDSRTVTCQASWTSAWPRSSRTLLYAGTFKLEPRPTIYHFSFSGLKKRYGCTLRSGARHCASKVHWRS